MASRNLRCSTKDISVFTLSLVNIDSSSESAIGGKGRSVTLVFQGQQRIAFHSWAPRCEPDWSRSAPTVSVRVMSYSRSNHLSDCLLSQHAIPFSDLLWRSLRLSDWPSGHVP